MNEVLGFLPLTYLVDAVIALTLLEIVALFVHHRITGRGLAPRDFVSNMLSGLFLMFALRSALVNAGWPWIILFLASAGLAHAADMARRWARQRHGF